MRRTIVSSSRKGSLRQLEEIKEKLMLDSSPVSSICARASIIGWSLADHLRSNLVLDALQTRPANRPIFLSDRGRQ